MNYVKLKDVKREDLILDQADLAPFTDAELETHRKDQYDFGLTWERSGSPFPCPTDGRTLALIREEQKRRETT